MRTNQVFPIRTLADLFNLPTSEMMSRALRELSATMVAAREVDDLIYETARALAEKDGKEFPPRREVQTVWPETVEWTDDEGVDSEARFIDPASGELALGVKVGVE